MAQGAVRVHGLKELVRAFDKFNRDLVHDLGDELEQAGEPVRKAVEEQVSPAGGMRGVVGQSAYVQHMRIGFSRPSTAYVAPLWRSNRGTAQGAVLAAAIRRRMDRAVEEKASEVEQRLGHFIDTLADDWGKGL
jgi:hypothetical protein